VGNVDQMFYQMYINLKDMRFLLCLWWPGEELISRACRPPDKCPFFGATSSPSCAQFTLLQFVKNQD